MKFLQINVCDIYIILWIVYYLQDMLLIKGVMAQFVLILLMLMSFYAFFQVNMHYKIGPYLKWLNVLLLIITIYGLTLFFSGLALYPDEFNIKTGLEFGYLQRFFTSVLPIYAFYLFSLGGQLSDINIKKAFFLFLLFSILIYYQNYFIVSKELEREEITNNMGYRFVPLIPMLSLIKMKDIWKYIFLTIIIVYILLAMKRGAILVGTIAFLLYMSHHLKVKSTKQAVYISILSIAVLCFLYFYIAHFYEESYYFQARVKSSLEGDASERNWMYPLYFNFFIERTSSFEFLFGCGANATLHIFGNFAHDDWLEFAINQGATGIILYAVYWICFVTEWYSYSGASKYKQALGDMIIIYFIISLFSMSFDGMPTAAALIIGYCLAQNEKAKRVQLINEIKTGC